MRQLETDTLIVVYPEGKRREAIRFARRAAYCREELLRRALIKGGASEEKAVLILPDVSINNAFVVPPLGREPIGVIPTHQTSDFFLKLNLPPDAGIIGCHEMTHYVQAQQIGGFPGALHAAFGDLYTPQIGLAPWFFEGLAVYYETRLQDGTGRLGTRYFEGFLAAGFQAEGEAVSGGLLSEFNRRVSFGHYLFGAYFVDYLARTFGEGRLWQVVKSQGRQVVPVFDVSGVFKSVYGKSLADLLEDFQADLRKRFPARKRAKGQRLLRKLGGSVRYVRGARGGEAFISADVDEPASISVVRDGELILERRLTDVLPGRTLNAPSVNLTSGLAFSPDERYLYFTVVDQGFERQVSRLVRLDVVEDRLSVVKRDLRGPGGSVDPEGRWYFHSVAVGDSYVLAKTELRTARTTRITRARPRHYLASPVVSPDGNRLLVTEASDAGVRLAIYAITGQRLQSVPAPEGQVFEASWVDEQRVIFTASDGRVMQAHIADLGTGAYRAVTQAAFLASQPWSDGRQVRFLNRDGWRFNLEQVAVPAAPRPPRGAVFQTDAWSPHALALPPGNVLAGRAVPAVRPAARALDPAAADSSAYLERRRVADLPVRIESDEPYSALDSLFLPNSWGPWFASAGGNTTYGVTVRGGDRLGFHEYAVAGAYNFSAEAPSGLFSYINASLAPVFVDLDVQHFASLDQGEDGDADDVRSRETVARLSARGAWGAGFESQGGVRFADILREIGPERATLQARQFAGPFVGLAWSAFEATPYAGVRRGLAVDALVSFFPRELSKFADFSVEDAAAGADVIVPLPLSRRHTLRAGVRGRALVGAPEQLTLLQVGGGSSDLIPDVLQASGGPNHSAGVLPPGLRFYEPLRGFEDLAFYTDRVATGELAYRYPVIIDAGNIATFRFLPRFFVRQIDLELFGAGALLPANEQAIALGASVTLRMAFWRVPFFLRSQLARRLTQDRAWAPYTALGIDL
ncbi:MAG: TolB family protein [Polyangiaceae bacterium]